VLVYCIKKNLASLNLMIASYIVWSSSLVHFEN
jgi:hypothetical protein